MTTDPDQIRSNIEQTQQNLSADVDSLTEKVSPPRIMERRVQQTRSGDDHDEGQDYGRHGGPEPPTWARLSALQLLRRKTRWPQRPRRRPTWLARHRTRLPARRTQGNPLTAGLIAFGAGWLLASLLPATEPEQRTRVAGEGPSYGERPTGRAATRPGRAGSCAGVA